MAKGFSKSRWAVVLYADVTSQTGDLYVTQFEAPPEYEIDSLSPAAFKITGPMVNSAASKEFDAVVEVSCEG